MTNNEYDIYSSIHAAEQDLLALLNQCPMKCDTRTHQLEITLNSQRLCALVAMLDIDDTIAKRRHGNDVLGDPVTLSEAEQKETTIKDAIAMTFFMANTTGQAEQDVLDMMEQNTFDPQKFDAAMDALAECEQKSATLPSASPHVTVADADQSATLVFSGNDVLQFLAGRGLNFPQSAHYTVTAIGR